LYRLLNEQNLIDSWKCRNLKAASGVDRSTAREYKKNLQENIKALAARLKEKRYRAKLVRRVYIPKSNGKLRP
jgi:RNA-directed DNA polymerase